MDTPKNDANEYPDGYYVLGTDLWFHYPDDTLRVARFCFIKPEPNETMNAVYQIDKFMPILVGDEIKLDYKLTLQEEDTSGGT
jgi:hypothetical protein